MALAKNLSKIKVSRTRTPKRKKAVKYAIIALVALAIIFGIYGIINLTRVAPKEEDKQEIVLETGDRPLPEEVKIWVIAEGGLNLRAEPDTKSEILATIPNDTELVAQELSGDWYKVTFDDKTGWIHKDYTRKFTDKEAVDSEIIEDWEKYSNSKYGYTITKPKDWVLRDYGANAAASLLSYVGFGAQLPDNIDPAILPPVVIKVTSDKKEIVETNYSKKTDVSVSEAVVSGVKSKKYVYTSSAGVQMTAYVVGGKVYTYILEESGGYAGELEGIVGSFKLL